MQSDDPPEPVVAHLYTTTAVCKTGQYAWTWPMIRKEKICEIRDSGCLETNYREQMANGGRYQPAPYLAALEAAVE